MSNREHDEQQKSNVDPLFKGTRAVGTLAYYLLLAHHFTVTYNIPSNSSRLLVQVHYDVKHKCDMQ